MTRTLPIHGPINGRRIALLGTSLVQQNHHAGERHIWSSARGWVTWAEVLSAGRLDIGVFHDPLVHPGWEPSGRVGVTRGFGGLNAGVSGQKARDIALRLDDVLKLDFDLIIVDAGTNDMMVETKEVIQATREAIVDRLLCAGKLVILLPILARGTQKWAAGGPERAKAHWINQKSLAFAAQRAGCHVFDWNEPWVDWSSADGVPQAGFSDDGTHFSVPGGYAVGKALAAYLAGFLSPPSARRPAPDDRFDPVNNPLGNLLPNLSLCGSGSFRDGVSVSGSNVVVDRLAGSTDGQDGWQVSLSEGQASIDILDRDYRNPLPAGAWVQASCLVDVDAHDGWREISLELQDLAPEGLTARALAPFDLGEGTLAPYPGEAWKGLLRTPPIRLKTSMHGLRLRLCLHLAPSPSRATMRITAPVLRQVVPPSRF